jgi:DNA-binding response OmpR family regulator
MTTRGVYFEKSTEPPRPSQPLRVLVVDDEIDSVRTLVTLLNEEGFQARGAYSGKQALEMLRDFDPDGVLIDIAMPDISGWELARRIRDQTGEARPMIIGLTGQYKQASDKILADMSGFNHYLLKPYDFPWLRRLLAALKEPR